MGVLVKYRFENLSEADVVLIGKGIGKLSINDAGELHGKLQAQINMQEADERERIAAERKAELDTWRAAELEKLKAEMPKQTATGKRKVR